MWFIFFFFKQMTAYVMRISDWSSDVCSSDLRLGRGACARIAGDGCGDVGLGGRREIFVGDEIPSDQDGRRQQDRRDQVTLVVHALSSLFNLSGKAVSRNGVIAMAAPRSEEHTSELQSLMRISYAVFCLKKKKIKNY